MTKYTVYAYLRRMLHQYWSKTVAVGLKVIRITLIVSVIPVLIAIFVECQPIHEMWQVLPSPRAQCRQGYVHLITMGVLDIATNLVLVIFPVPIIMTSGMTLWERLKISSLFTISLFLVVLTSNRIAFVIDKHGLQQFRSVFASSDIIAACTVSNIIIIGSFIRDRGLKKNKYRPSSTVDSFDRRSSAPRQHSDESDEDLARSMGYRTNPDLIDRPPPARKSARPVSIADLERLNSHGQSAPPFSNSVWAFPNGQSRVSEYSEFDARAKDPAPEDPFPSPRNSRKVSFFDAGGLIENGQSGSTEASPTDTVVTQDFAPQPRRTSRSSVSHMSNGRSLLPSTRRSSRFSQHSEDIEMTRIPPAAHIAEYRSFLEDGSSSEGGPSVHNDHLSSAARRSSMRVGGSYNAPFLQDAGYSNRRMSTPSLRDVGGLL